MNYLQQIKAFERWEQLHPLSDKAYRLWHKLMVINQDCDWADWFPVPQRRLKLELQTFSDQTVVNTRNRLITAGRLRVKKDERGRVVAYHLVPFEMSGAGSVLHNRELKSGAGSGVGSGAGSVLHDRELKSGAGNGADSGADSGASSGVSNRMSGRNVDIATISAVRGKPVSGQTVGGYPATTNTDINNTEYRSSSSSSSGSSKTDQNEIDEVSDRGGAKIISGSDSFGQQEQDSLPTATSAPVANQGEAQAIAMAPVAVSAGQMAQSATDYSQQAQQLGLKLTPKIRQGLNQLTPDAAAYVLQYAHDNATSNATGYLQTLLNSFGAATSLVQVQDVIQSYHSRRRKGKIHEQLPDWAQKDYQAASASKISPEQVAKTNAHIAELMSDRKTDKQGV